MTDEWKEKKFGLPNSDALAEILERTKNSPFNEIGGSLINPDYVLYKGKRHAAAILEVKGMEIKKYWKSEKEHKDGIPLGEPDEILLSEAGEICGGHSRQVFKDSIDLIKQHLQKGYKVSYISLNAEENVFKRNSLAHLSFDYSSQRATKIGYNATFEEKIAPVLEIIGVAVQPL